MLTSVFKFVIRRFIDGPGRSWVYTSAFLALLRFARNQTGRRELIDISKSKPGDQFIIEHLDISHEAQIKDFKAQKKAGKRRLRAEKREARRLKKELRRARTA